jgi:outer membrane protein assembly factor BamB
MRKVIIILFALVYGCGASVATAYAAPPPAGWSQDGYGPGNTRYNPGESVINAGSVGRLRLRWTISPAHAGPGCESSPVVPLAVGNRVFLLDGGGVAAYNAATGKRQWRNTGFGLITANLIVAGGLVLVFDTGCNSYSSYDGYVTALDAATGAQRWRKTGSWRIDGVVADAGTVVTSGYCGTCDDAAHGVVAYRLTDGAQLWTHPNETLAGPVSANGTILLHRTTGSNDTWATRIGTGAPTWGTTVASTAVATNPSGSQFYLTDSGGLGARLAGSGRQLWQVPKESGDLAADGRRVYVASVGRVNTYDATTGRIVWTRALANPRAPVRAGSLLYILYGNGILAVLSAADGRPITTGTTYSGLTQHVVPAGGRLVTTQKATIRGYAP